MMWSCPKQVVADEVWCLNKHNGMGSATDSLDYRARVCYLPCSLLYNEYYHAYWHELTFGSPLRIIEYALQLVNQGLYHSQAKTDKVCSLINSCAGPETNG